MIIYKHVNIAKGRRECYGDLVRLRVPNGDLHLVTIGWWNRFLDNQIKDLTASANGLTFGTRGNGTYVHLEPREEAGRRGIQNAAG